MITRSLIRGSLCLLAALAAGCGSLRGFLAEPPLPPAPANQTPTTIPNTKPAPGGTGVAPPADAIPGGTVIAAGGAASKFGPHNPPIQPAEGTPGPMPIPAPPAAPPPAPPGTPQLPQPRPLPVQPAPQPAGHSHRLPPGVPPGAVPFADPNLRSTPTVAGKAWELGPWETPTDRLAELTANLEAVLVQNKALLARAKELETLGATREQALVEAMREIDAVNAAAAKERAAMLAQVAALQTRIQQLEEDEIRFLEELLRELRRIVEKKP